MPGAFTSAQTDPLQTTREPGGGASAAVGESSGPAGAPAGGETAGLMGIGPAGVGSTGTGLGTAGDGTVAAAGATARRSAAGGGLATEPGKWSALATIVQTTGYRAVLNPIQAAIVNTTASAAGNLGIESSLRTGVRSSFFSRKPYTMPDA